MSRFCDTHCHLNLNSFQEDLPAVLARSRDAGVHRILVPGIDLLSSQSAVDLALDWPEIFAAIGIHPTDAATWDDQSLGNLRALASHPKVVAIGEIGLDYYHDRTTSDSQKAILRAQLELARDLNLPVILHNRNSFEDLWMMIQEWLSSLRLAGSPLLEKPGVFHSFEGSLEEARLVVQARFCLGISGPVTYKNAADRREIAASIPLEQLVLETDAPFLTPQPQRGKRNEPAYITYIGEKLAELRGLDIETITGVTADNAARLFAWEP